MSRRSIPLSRAGFYLQKNVKCDTIKSGEVISMVEDALMARREDIPSDLLQKILKFQTEEHPGTIPLVLFPSREQADLFRKQLQELMGPMFAQ